MDFIQSFLKLPESSRQKIQEALSLLQNVGCSSTEVDTDSESNNSKDVTGLLKNLPNKPASSQKTLDKWIVKKSPLNTKKENSKLSKETVQSQAREKTPSNSEDTAENNCFSKSSNETSNLPCSSASSSHEELVPDINSVESINNKKLLVLIERQDLKEFLTAPETISSAGVVSERLSPEAIEINDDIKSKVVDGRTMKSDNTNFSSTNQSKTEQNKVSTKKQTENPGKKLSPAKQTKSPIKKRAMDKELKNLQLEKSLGESQSVKLTKTRKHFNSQCENHEQDAIPCEDEPRSYNLRSARRDPSEKLKTLKGRTTNTPTDHIVQSSSVTESENSRNMSKTNLKVDPKHILVTESSDCSGNVNLESNISSCSNEGSNKHKRSAKTCDFKVDSGYTLAVIGQDKEVSIKDLSAETSNIVIDENPIPILADLNQVKRKGTVGGKIDSGSKHAVIEQDAKIPVKDLPAETNDIVIEENPIPIEGDFNQARRKRKRTVSDKINSGSKHAVIEQDVRISANNLYAETNNMVVDEHPIPIEKNLNRAKRKRIVSDKNKKKQLDLPNAQQSNEGLNAKSSDISRIEVTSGENDQSTTGNTSVQLVDESVNTSNLLKGTSKQIPKTVVKTPTNKKQGSKKNISESVPKPKKKNKGETYTGKNLNEAENQDLPPNTVTKNSNLLKQDIVPNVKQNAQPHKQLEFVNNLLSLSLHSDNGSIKNSEHLLTEKVTVTQSSVSPVLMLAKKNVRKKCSANKKEFLTGANENSLSSLVSEQQSSHPVKADINSIDNSLEDSINENQTEKAIPKKKHKRSHARKSISTTEKNQSSSLITHNLPADSQCRNDKAVDNLSAESVTKPSEVTENRYRVSVTTCNQPNSTEGEHTCMKQTRNSTIISPTVSKTKWKKTACTEKDTQKVESLILSQGTESCNISMNDSPASDPNSAPCDKIIAKSLQKSPENLKASPFKVQDSEADLQDNILNSDSNTPQTECLTTSNTLQQLGSSKKETRKQTKPARSKQHRVRRKGNKTKIKVSSDIILPNISESSRVTVLQSQKDVADSEPEFLSPKTHFRRGIKKKLQPLLTELATTNNATHAEADRMACKHVKLAEDLAENKIIPLKNSLLDIASMGCKEDDILFKSQIGNKSSENLDLEKAMNTEQDISLLKEKDILERVQSSALNEVSDSNEKAQTRLQADKNKNLKRIIHSIKKKNFTKNKQIVKKPSTKKNSRTKLQASDISAELVPQMCHTNTELGHIVDSEKIQDKNQNTCSDTELLDNFSENKADVMERMDVTVECTADQNLIKETIECTANISANLNCTEQTIADIDINDKMKLNYVAFVRMSKELAKIDLAINDLFQNSKMANSIKSIPSDGIFIFKKNYDTKESVIIYKHVSKKELKEIICKLKKTEEVK